jgi:uncharacterized membrane protein (UPF0136 family)
MLEIAKIVLGVYGLLLIIGGIMGKVKTGSTVSVIAGTASGFAALIAFWVSRTDPGQGLLIGLMVSLLLTGVFMSRFIRTRKLMPAGIVLIMSIIVAALLAVVRNQLPASM